MSVGEGAISVCVWFGDPIMQRMSGLSLAWHWQADCEHVHLRTHSGFVCSGGLLLKVHALVNVKNLVFLLACSVWVMRCTALLCCAILVPFRYGCSQFDNRFGQCVSVTQCTIRVLVCKGPKYIRHVVTHVLGIFEFESPSDLGICHAFIFP